MKALIAAPVLCLGLVLTTPAAEKQVDAVTAAIDEALRHPAADKPKKDALAALKPLSPSDTSRQYCGKSEADILALFGAPIEVTTGTNPKIGAIKILTYDKTKGSETSFAMLQSDKIVFAGAVKGVPITKPQSP
jgi:hypothetical protein